MEIVLQLLDELEDLCCAIAFSWSRLRPWLLVLGLCAASLLPASRSWPAEWAAVSPALAGVALASILVWTVALLASFVLALERRTLRPMP